MAEPNEAPSFFAKHLEMLHCSENNTENSLEVKIFF